MKPLINSSYSFIYNNMYLILRLQTHRNCSMDENQYLDKSDSGSVRTSSRQ